MSWYTVTWKGGYKMKQLLLYLSTTSVALADLYFYYTFSFYCYKG